MQGITMSRVKKAISESYLKTMTRYANKYFVAKRRKMHAGKIVLGMLNHEYSDPRAHLKKGCFF